MRDEDGKRVEILNPESQAQKLKFKVHALIPHPSSLIPLLVVALVLLYGVVYPNLYVIAAALGWNGESRAGGLWEILLRRAVLESAATSVGLSLLTVVLCAAVGVPLAFLFERYQFPARR